MITITRRDRRLIMIALAAGGVFGFLTVRIISGTWALSGFAVLILAWFMLYLIPFTMGLVLRLYDWLRPIVCDAPQLELTTDEERSLEKIFRYFPHRQIREWRWQD